MSGSLFSISADNFLDELRIGATYADVAPIAVPVELPGDFDFDADVDGADFLIWQRDLGDATNLADWQDNFGATAAVSAVKAVPEPSSLLLACIMAMAAAAGRSRASCVK